jgi:glycine betaine/proline transport system ATP-binding protein
MPEFKIKIEGLYKIFGKNPAAHIDTVKGGTGKDELLDKHEHILGLNDINLGIADRSIHVIMGLSGSGKSTLIRHINRLIEPTVGDIYVDGDNVMKLSEQELLEFRRNKTAMVFQKFALLPHKTIIENAALGLQLREVEVEESRQRAQKWIDRVGLSGVEEHFPKQLSGGMQQRVGLARALANDNDILLMDEAFSALDPLIRKDMQEMLLSLQSELHKTIVFITHDLDEALRIGDRISILKDGIMVQDGSLENILLHPADDYVADFVKDVNRLKVLRLRTVMVPLEEAGNIREAAQGIDRVEENTVVEGILEGMISQRYNTVEVIDQEGQVKGYVTPREINEILIADGVSPPSSA